MDDSPSFGGRASTRPARERPAVRPRGRARPVRRRVRVIASDDEADSGPEAAHSPPQPSPPTPTGGGPRSPTARPPPPPPPRVFDMEADISELKPATFSTIPRGQPEPMLRLNWGHKVNLIATKVLNPLIHLCEKCDCPILLYGRMIPCKHVLCYDCAKVQDKCWRCGDRAVRVERAGLGKLFMCLHDGKRYDVSGCRRTYLSQRDLQAHINHRHCRIPGAAGVGMPVPVRAAPEPLAPPPPPPPRRMSEDRPPPDPRDPRRHDPRGAPPAYGQHVHGHSQMHGGHDSGRGGHGSHGTHSGGHGSHDSVRGGHSHGDSAGSSAHVSPRPTAYGSSKPSPLPMKQQQIPVMTSQRSSNLITIPIQGQEPASEHTPPPPRQQQQQQYGGYQAGYSSSGPQHTAYQPPAVSAAAFYQTTPPPAAGYSRPFPPSGPPPPPQPPPPTGYGAPHTGPHSGPHTVQHSAPHTVPHGTPHGSHGAPHGSHGSHSVPHGVQPGTQHGSHGSQHGAPHGTHGPPHGAPLGSQHGAPHGTHGAPHGAPHGTSHGSHGAPHGTHGTQHGAPQPWSSGPPLGRPPPPASHYYR